MKKILLFCIAVMVHQSNTFAMANPASVNCQKLGGKIVIKNSKNGQHGICVKGNKKCEEWALFKKECSLH
jgi:putative hemolysin